MALKWMAVMVATVAAALCVTANILVAALAGGGVPDVINMFAIGAAAVATVVAVLADLYTRIDGRITALTELLVTRLNELDTHTGDRNAGFVEGYLLSHGPDAEVVPIGPRRPGRRAMTGGDE